MMKKLFACALMSAFCLWGVDGEVNLLSVERFQPCELDGMIVGTRGWWVSDSARAQANSDQNYVSGEDCFVFECKDDVATFTFKEPLHSVYAKYGNDFVFVNRQGYPTPPAPQYHTTGRIKVTKGQARLNIGLTVKPSSDWQVIDKYSSSGFENFRFKPVAGASYSVSNLKSYPVYPRIGGEIALPDGGKLTRFLMPRNANYLTRWSISVWRGWLWKLTGVALPIETVDTIVPTKGAFVVMQNHPEYGYWDLKVDKEGIVLSVNTELSINPALFDYLRLGYHYGFYAVNCIKGPADGSIKELVAIDRKARPKYRQFTGGSVWATLGGGVNLPMLYGHNDMDYYHLPAPKNDHLMNIVLPTEHYYKDHPEYFAMDYSGNRPDIRNVYHTNPCFSNPETMRIMVDNAVKYAKSHVAATRLCVTTGDINTHCKCPECIKFNGGEETSSDFIMEFDNQMADRLAKELPEMYVQRAAYASRRSVPKFVKPRGKIGYVYCLDEDIVRCSLHTNCEVNQKALQNLKEWYDYAGRDPKKIGYEIYRDVRPYNLPKRMEELAKYGEDFVFIWVWKGQTPAMWFVMARWNLGEDLESLVAEFDNAYYGAAGDLVHQVNQLVEEYAVHYKHTTDELKNSRHIGIWRGGDGVSKSVLDRATYKKVYALLDKAEALVKDTDKQALKRVLMEKTFYLNEDVCAMPRLSCKTPEQLKDFITAFSEIVRIAKMYPTQFDKTMHWGQDSRRHIATVTGLPLSETKKYWMDEPEVEKIIKNPASAFSTKVEKIPGGWYFNPSTFKGGNTPIMYSYECPLRCCYGIHRNNLPEKNAFEVVLTLDKAPAKEMYLALEGLDDDKPGTCLLKVEVNGNLVFNGPNTFKEDTWTKMAFTLKPQWLKAGDNIIKLTNMTPNLPTRSARFKLNSQDAIDDSQWGWMTISEICVMDINNEFDAFKNGSQKTIWRGHREAIDKYPGTVTVENGSVILSATENQKNARLFCFQGHQTPKTAVNPGDKIVMRVKVSGEGSLQLTQVMYAPYCLDAMKKPIIPMNGYPKNFNFRQYMDSKNIPLTAEEKWVAYECVVPQRVGHFFPRITLTTPGKAIISDLQIQIVRK